MNRRGQELTFILMPVIALALAIAALMIMLTASKDFSGEKTFLAVQDARFGEEYVISTAKAIAKEAIALNDGGLDERIKNSARAKDLRMTEAGNFFGKIRNNEFSFELLGESYIFKISGLFVQSIERDSSLKRNFDLCMKFDENGDFIGDC